MLKRANEITELREALTQAKARVAELEAQRSSLLRTDPATGTHSSEAFRQSADHELERVRRSGAPLALVVYEVDDRHRLNAVRGADGAERAVTALARLLREHCRSHDLIGRTGPAELSVLLPETPLDGALLATRRIVETIDATDVEGLGPVTVSAGVALAAPKITLEGLVAEAAAHLARAQAEGGGRACGPLDAREQPVARLHRDVIDALASALTERDRYTGNHSQSVVQLSRAVAETLSLDDQTIERVCSAALLHDIGKVAIPDSILHKPDQLDESEWVLMREQPLIGERILKAIPGMGAIARIVRHEHERWDGSGYPDGLKGEEIPLGSRIILACDTYHAMTSDGPYREAMGHTAALEEVARCAGTQFDPRVTEALIGQLWYSRQGGRR